MVLVVLAVVVVTMLIGFLATAAPASSPPKAAEVGDEHCRDLSVVYIPKWRYPDVYDASRPIKCVQEWEGNSRSIEIDRPGAFVPLPFGRKETNADDEHCQKRSLVYIPKRHYPEFYDASRPVNCIQEWEENKRVIGLQRPGARIY